MKENKALIPVVIIVLILAIAGGLYAMKQKSNTAGENQSMAQNNTTSATPEVSPSTTASVTATPDVLGTTTMPDMSGTPMATTTPTADFLVTGTPQASTADAVSIAVEGGAFYFKPNEIRAKVGQKVKITLTGAANGAMPHNLYIDEFNVKSTTVKPGETTTVEFTPDKAGTFEYYCNVGQHRKNGQVGKLIVE